MESEGEGVKFRLASIQEVGCPSTPSSFCRCLLTRSKSDGLIFFFNVCCFGVSNLLRTEARRRLAASDLKGRRACAPPTAVAKKK